MSGERRILPPDLLPSGKAARALGVSTRHLPRLVDRGILPPPERQAGRNLWPADAIERALRARREHRPSNRHHARKGPDIARRVRRDRTVVARVFLGLLEHGEPGLQIACAILRAHAPLGLRRLTTEQLAYLVGQLEAADRTIRVAG